jgi:TetR/AcrR family transcriptional repressor of nem operon
MVGRPRKIETDVILDLVIKVFWQKGYEATSMVDIMQVTGLHKGSIYQTFGDKRSLFIAALKSYMDDVYNMNRDTINSYDDPTEGIKQSLYAKLSMTYNDDENCKISCTAGCMEVNTLVETAPHDEEIQGIMQVKHEKIKQLITGTLRKIEKKNNRKLTQSIDMTFAMLMTLMNGLSTNMKTFMGLEEAKLIIDQQLMLMKITD